MADLRRTVADLGKRTSASHKRLVLFIIAVGAVLRALPLVEPVVHAEAFSFVHFVRGPWSEVFSDRTLPGNHILHTLLVKAFAGSFGSSPMVLRLPDLIAGILVMPAYYIFVRAMFNRYVAVLALALVAGSGPLIEGSSLSLGLSIGWLLHVLALLAGRHFVKENNLLSAFLSGLFLAFALWCDPHHIYPALMVLVWVPLYLLTSYSNTLGKRMLRWSLMLAVTLVGTVLLYLPVIATHGLDHVMDPGNLHDLPDWSGFVSGHAERAFELWLHITATASGWVALIGFVALFTSVYLSGKYRMLVLALVLGCVPLVMLRMHVAPPRTWSFMLFTLHLGSALALFYLLKQVQERVWAGFSKRIRTAVTSLVLVAAFGAAAQRQGDHQLPRYGEAALFADLFARLSAPGDRVIAQEPWEAPVAYYLSRKNSRWEEVMVQDLPPGEQRCFVLVAPGDGQDLEGVLRHHEVASSSIADLELVRDLERTEIFAVRTKGDRP